MNDFNNADKTGEFTQALPSPSLSELAAPYTYRTPSSGSMEATNNVAGPRTEKPKRRSRTEDLSYEDQEQFKKTEALLKKSYEAQEQFKKRESILKEEYIKAQEKAYTREKELLNDRFQVLDYIGSQADNSGDPKLVRETLTKQMALQNEMQKHEESYDRFRDQAQDLLRDQADYVDFTPQYEETAPEDHETPVRTEFRKQNEWYNFESNQYNPDLVNTSNAIEKQMRNEYQLKNMGQYIESPEYFSDLKSRIYNQFGIQQQEQTYMQNNNPYNPFVPNQPPQLNNNPQSMMQQMAPAMDPNTPNQMAYNYNNQALPSPQIPPMMQQPPSRFGPPTAPVTHQGMGPSQPQMNSNEMFSQKAFDIFMGAMPAAKISHLSQDDKVKLFQHVIKTQGRTR